MHKAALLPATASLLEEMRGAEFLETFYLSGGTALALHIGHRVSEDLDFFSPHPFNPKHLQSQLEQFDELDDVLLEEGTLNGFLKGVKLQFLHYPYPLLQDSTKWDGVSISSILDIACTKLITISMSGSRKDFVDLYFLLERFSLREIFEHLDRQYQSVQYNRAHIAKGLLFFEDAQEQPMPRMLRPLEWSTVKERVEKSVRNWRLFDGG